MLVKVVFFLFLLTGFFILAFSLGQLSLLLLYFRKKPIRWNKVDATPLPSVTVQLPVFNELNVVERLIDAVIKLKFPKDLLHTQVLDDSTDATSMVIADKVTEYQQLGYKIEHIKRENRSGFKAGALQLGLESSNSEFIAIFDADFVPSPDFLNDILSYFSNPSVGMVQTRWEYFNAQENWLTKVQQMALNGHFIIDQEARNKNGLFMNFNGTAGIWRTKCLQDAGGWDSNTLTEDLDISYRAQLKGWQFIYCTDLSNRAELPTKISAVIDQQFRWVKGSIETSLKIIPKIIRSELSWIVKANGIIHLLSNYVYLIVMLNSILTLPILILKNQHPHLNSFLTYSPILAVVFLINLFYCYTAASANAVRKAGIENFIPTFTKLILLYLGMSLNNTRAGIEAFFGYKTSFVRTPKYNSKNNQHIIRNYKTRFIYTIIIPELLVFFYFLAAIILSIYFEDFTFLPFHLLLLSGFGLVIYTYIKER